jgi:hypothetical protein
MYDVLTNIMSRGVLLHGYNMSDPHDVSLAAIRLTVQLL